MGRPRATLIADILIEHYEELDYLWGRRQSALSDPAYTPRELADLEERVEAHVQGLLIAGDQLVPLVRAGLGSDEPTVAFASAYPLLRLNRDDAAGFVLEAFLQAKDGPLAGLTWALSHGPVAPILPQLRAAMVSGPPAVAAMVAEVLAFHAPADVDAEAFHRLLIHEEPAIRRQGWRASARLKTSWSPKFYQAALGDPEPSVRREVLHAAAWAAQPWILDRCRASAREPVPESFEELRLLAVLGQPQDCATLRQARCAEVLGAAWFTLLGITGSPGVIPDLIRGMEDPDPRLAVEAGKAFARITGRDVQSQVRVQLPPEDGHEPDDFEKQFLDEAFLPDPAMAREHWEKIKGRSTEAPRWCRGSAVTREITRGQAELLDLPARYEAYLRARFDGRWNVNPVFLERFPQGRPGPSPGVGTR